MRKLALECALNCILNCDLDRQRVNILDRKRKGRSKRIVDTFAAALLAADIGLSQRQAEPLQGVEALSVDAPVLDGQRYDPIAIYNQQLDHVAGRRDGSGDLQHCEKCLQRPVLVGKNRPEAARDHKFDCHAGVLERRLLLFDDWREQLSKVDGIANCVEPAGRDQIPHEVEQTASYRCVIREGLQVPLLVFPSHTRRHAGRRRASDYRKRLSHRVQAVRQAGVEPVQFLAVCIGWSRSLQAVPTLPGAHSQFPEWCG
jgi:hypothetical protein